MKQFFKNIIGRLLGFVDCPNCGNSYWRRPFGSIMYRDKPGSEIHHRGLVLCTTCLSTPTSLDAERIASALKRLYWKDASIEKAKKAVLEYKVEIPDQLGQEMEEEMRMLWKMGSNNPMGPPPWER